MAAGDGYDGDGNCRTFKVQQCAELHPLFPKARRGDARSIPGEEQRAAAEIRRLSGGIILLPREHIPMQEDDTSAESGKMPPFLRLQ